MSKDTILVVGGAGYIGSHVNKFLHSQGFNTVVFDNLSRSHPDAVIRGNFFEGDTANIEDLRKVFANHKFRAVMHFAASIAVGESVVNPAKYYRNNVTNTLNLLDVMLENDVKTLIFSSTAAVYGNPNSSPITEDHTLNPINPYGKTKLIVENILKDYDHAYGLKAICLRYFNAAGGDPDGEIKYFPKQESNLIPIALNKLLSDEVLNIFGDDYSTDDGTCMRDYIHIYDLATAHVSALKKLFDGANSAFYNLGNGKGFSVAEVVESIKAVTGQNLKTVISERRAGDPSALMADASKAARELSWIPKYPAIEDMIRHAWQSMNIAEKVNF
jgi:UDP-glucose 4-epimerase